MKRRAGAGAGRIALLLAVFVVVGLALLVRPASAHELEIDTLYIRVDSVSHEIAGQLLLDPDLTRPQTAGSDETVSLQGEQARLLSFVRDHVTLQADEQTLELALDVRELYAKGGAVPGDSVVYRATLPARWRKLSVRITAPLERLAVTTSVDTAQRPTILLSGEQPVVVHENAHGTANPKERGNTSAPSQTPRPLLTQIIDHVWTGIVHIVPLGWDHILFVVALTLGSVGKWRRLLFELSAFTVAHTFTLALGALGIVELAPSIVEPLIALSIAVVALEHLVELDNAKLRYAVVGFFGLLHGLGFAGALLELGLSSTSFLLFLASFNVGVELGQLVIVGASLGIFWLLARWPQRRKVALKALAFAIAACGLIVGAARLFDDDEPAPSNMTKASSTAYIEMFSCDSMPCTPRRT